MNIHEPKYAPRVIVFACNSCGFGEVDMQALAQRPEYAHTRMLRTMCTGRVHPAFVIRAFEEGVDGVLITGCAPGKCEYITGNDHARESFEIISNLARVLGIEAERIGFEWLDAESNESFSQIIRWFVDKLIPLGEFPPPVTNGFEPSRIDIDSINGKLNAMLCLDCGKCTSACPVTKVHDDFSPRQIVRDGHLHDESGWTLDHCISCSLCDYRCPQRVSISQKIAVLKTEAHESGAVPHRPHGAVFDALGSLMLRPDLPVNHSAWLTPDLITAESGDTLLYVGCAPYHDAFFPNLNVRNLDAARGAVKVLNHLGIEPMVLKDERCCGHDAYWEGNLRRFQQLARENSRRVIESGAKEIIFTCPECMFAMRDLYTQAGMPMKLRMRMITEVIAENKQKLNLRAFPIKVTFQDPCRLARNLSDITSARDALAAIPGVGLQEMAHTGAAASCCAGKWSHCDAQTKVIQNARLKEATRSGAELLVTACPKCEIHLRCAMQGSEGMNFEIRDLTSLVADALPDAAPDLLAVNESFETKNTPRV